jgi:hypothetical protein
VEVQPHHWSGLLPPCRPAVRGRVFIRPHHAAAGTLFHASHDGGAHDRGDVVARTCSGSGQMSSCGTYNSCENEYKYDVTSRTAIHYILYVSYIFSYVVGDMIYNLQFLLFSKLHQPTLPTSPSLLAFCCFIVIIIIIIIIMK